MVTNNPRINVTFEKETVSILFSLADQEHKSLSGIVKEFTLEALERREDFHLSKIAEKVDLNKSKLFTHNDVWK